MAFEEKDYFLEIIGILGIVLIIQAILFSFFHKIGIFFTLGLLIYFMFFIYRDKKIKKEELDKILYYKKSWVDYKRKLSKNIP